MLILRSASNNSSYTAKPCYLPVHYHYRGMDMIKAGRGYGTGKPLGVESGPCKSDDCEGTIITLKINTSVKGFETSTEKVCNTCGRVYPLGFQIIGKPPVSVEMNKWSSHESWLQDMKQSQVPKGDYEDVDANLEALCNWNGTRLNTQDSTSYGDSGIGTENPTHYINPDYKERLDQAEGRLKNTNPSKKVPMKVWRENDYIEIVGDYAHELDLTGYQIEDVIYILKHRGSKFDTKYSMEDIILSICLYVVTKKMGFQLKGTLLSKFFRTNPNLKTLYPLVKDKING